MDKKTFVLVLLGIIGMFVLGLIGLNKLDRLAQIKVASAATEVSAPAETKVPEAPLSSQNLDCVAAFQERGSSEEFAKKICADPQPGGPAVRMTAGEICEGFGTVTYDNQSNVWVKENFSEDGSVAFYAYCYPNGADIRNAPFFTGSELSPITGNAFDVIFPEPEPAQ